jgi:cytochrome b
MNSTQEVKVWDPLVRIFHWSLVAAFTIAYLTGDEESALHEWSGYVVIGLVLFRVLWGLIGTRYARFSDFIYGPAAIISYVRDMALGRPKRYLGHNPLGGIMILVMLASLLATGLTGLGLQKAEENEARLAPVVNLSRVASATVLLPVAYADEDEEREEKGEHEEEHGEEEANEWLEELHEFFANFTVLLVLLHITGVLLGSLMHRENLVRAMFTGRKTIYHSTEEVMS